MNRAARIIAWTLLVLLLLGGIAAIWYYTDGGTEDLKTFSLTCDGKTIVNEKSTMRMKPGGSHAFGVKYLFDASQGSRGYSAKVVPSPEADFSYTVDDTRCTWSTLEDLTVYFISEQTESGFRLGTAEDFSLASLMQALYPGRSVALPDPARESGLLYRLIVASDNEKTIYTVDFAVTAASDAEGGQAAEHAITVSGTPGGTTWLTFVCPERASAGSTVYFLVAASSGSPYPNIQSIEIKTSSGADVEWTFAGGWYSFVMPDESVSIVVYLSYR